MDTQPTTASQTPNNRATKSQLTAKDFSQFLATFVPLASHFQPTPSHLQSGAASETTLRSAPFKSLLILREINKEAKNAVSEYADSPIIPITTQIHLSIKGFVDGPGIAIKHLLTALTSEERTVIESAFNHIDNETFISLFNAKNFPGIKNIYGNLNGTNVKSERHFFSHWRTETKKSIAYINKGAVKKLSFLKLTPLRNSREFPEHCNVYLFGKLSQGSADSNKPMKFDGIVSLHNFRKSYVFDFPFTKKEGFSEKEFTLKFLLENSTGSQTHRDYYGNRSQENKIEGSSLLKELGLVRN